jgi:hypothetical protein
MRVQPMIRVEVVVHYLDIEDLRFRPQVSNDRVAEITDVRASAHVGDDDGLKRPFITARGKYVNKDGEVGLRDCRISYGRLDQFPEDWQQRIIADLQALADKVTVSE